MLRKELVELGLLHLLKTKDCYGYEMLSHLHGAFPDTQESAIYAILRGLCHADCTESYQGDASDGPKRKYYRLTEKGCDMYKQRLSQWQSLQRAFTLLGI